MKNTQKGSALVWVVVVVVIVAVGVYFYSSTTTVNVSDDGSVVTNQEQNTMTNNTNASIKIATCDWSKIKKITQTGNDGSSQSFDLVNGKLMVGNIDMSSLLETFCNTGANTALETNASYGVEGYNTDGKWFSIPNGDMEAKMKISFENGDGQKYIITESRIVNTAMNNQLAVFATKMKISMTTGLMAYSANINIPGSDTMTSKTTEDLAKMYPNLFRSVEYKYE